MTQTGQLPSSEPQEYHAKGRLVEDVRARLDQRPSGFRAVLLARFHERLAVGSPWLATAATSASSAATSTVAVSAWGTAAQISASRQESAHRLRSGGDVQRTLQRRSHVRVAFLTHARSPGIATGEGAQGSTICLLSTKWMSTETGWDNNQGTAAGLGLLAHACSTDCTATRGTNRTTQKLQACRHDLQRALDMTVR